MTDVSKELGATIEANIILSQELTEALESTLAAFTEEKTVGKMAVVVAAFSLLEGVASQAITDEVSAFVVDQLCVKLRKKLTTTAGAALAKRSGN